MGNRVKSNTDDTDNTETTDKKLMVLNPPDGVCNTPMSDSYTWSAAERVVGRQKHLRACVTCAIKSLAADFTEGADGDG